MNPDLVLSQIILSHQLHLSPNILLSYEVNSLALHIYLPNVYGFSDLVDQTKLNLNLYFKLQPLLFYKDLSKFSHLPD